MHSQTRQVQELKNNVIQTASAQALQMLHKKIHQKDSITAAL